jgi:hypothetical protein
VRKVAKKDETASGRTTFDAGPERLCAASTGLLGSQPAAATPLGTPSETVELFFDTPTHKRLPSNDDELVDRAAHIQTLLGRRVVFVTGDTGAAFRAQVAGLTVQTIEWANRDERGS